MPPSLKVQVFIITEGGQIKTIMSNCPDSLDVEIVDRDVGDDIEGLIRLNEQEEKLQRCKDIMEFATGVKQIE